MYRYVEDKIFLSNMRELCGDMMQDLCHLLSTEFDISSTFYLVGSGARNLITQNNSEPIDLDYNLEITGCYDFEDCKYIKECARKAFNIVLRDYGFRDCDDSTSSLTSKEIIFNEGNRTPFSIDICITTLDNNGNYYRLIHQKTGMSIFDQYYWNCGPNTKNLRKKSLYIKEKGKWMLVRQQYLDIKNRYLIQRDHNHPSFICYIEAVNNVYNNIK